MKKRQEGFTIVEVVISMVLLSIILVTLAGLTYSTAQRAISATTVSQRQSFAMETVNRLTTLPYASLPGAAGCTTVGSTNNQFSNCVTVSVGGNSTTIQVVTTPLHRSSLGASGVTFVRTNNNIVNPLCSGC
jgi:prepilin-type N-terminal cleavage/methylation domain-containing protein